MPDWDKSHDWVLLRSRNDFTRVKIQFHHPRPSVFELHAVRRCLPEFQNVAPTSILEKVTDLGELSLGTMPTREAQRLIDALKQSGLQVVGERNLSVSYLPLDRTSGSALLIEDEVESAAMAQAMIAAGVPIEDFDGPAKNFVEGGAP